MKTVSPGAAALLKKLRSAFEVQLWSRWIDALDPIERRFIDAMRKYFDRQKRYAVETFEKTGNVTFGAEWDEQLRETTSDVLMDATMIGIKRMYAEHAHNERRKRTTKKSFAPGDEMELVDLALSMLSSYTPVFIKSVNVTTAKAIAQIVKEGYMEGLSDSAIAGNIARWYDDSNAHRARTIARTETNRAANMAYTYAAARLNYTRKRWVTALDEHVCPICSPLNGKTIDLYAHFSGEYTTPTGRRVSESSYTPPIHPNCVVGDSIIVANGDVLTVTRRWYDGTIITIRTIGDRELRVTPNHPISIIDGFVPAETLKVGDTIESRDENGLKAIEMFNNFVNRDDIVRITIDGEEKQFHGDGKNESRVFVAYRRDKEVVATNDTEKRTSNTDKIESIEREKFSGYVYNFETTTGTYVVDGVVTHNCRCTVVATNPVRPRLAKPLQRPETIHVVANPLPKEQREKWAKAVMDKLNDRKFVSTHPIYADVVAERNLETITDFATAYCETHGKGDPNCIDRTVDEVRDILREKLDSMYEKAVVLRRTHSSTLMQVLTEDGRFKAQYETNRSAGAYDPGTRHEAEDLMFGTENVPDEYRPVYGLWAFPGWDNPLNEHELDYPVKRARNYGPIIVELKKSVKERTSFTFGDSLDCIYYKVCPMGYFTHKFRDETVAYPPWALQALLDKLRPGDKRHDAVKKLKKLSIYDMLNSLLRTNTVYTEAQIHGSVGVEDIEKVWIDNDFPLYAPDKYEKLKKLLDKLGIPRDTFGGY